MTRRKGGGSCTVKTLSSGPLADLFLKWSQAIYTAGRPGSCTCCLWVSTHLHASPTPSSQLPIRRPAHHRPGSRGEGGEKPAHQDPACRRGSEQRVGKLLPAFKLHRGNDEKTLKAFEEAFLIISGRSIKILALQKNFRRKIS